MTEADIRTIEPELRGAVSAERLQEHLVTFSHLFRDSGTRDERQAADYLLGQLASYGLQPELLTFNAFISYPREGTLTVMHPNGEEEAIPVRTRSFGGVTTGDGVTAELVFVPFQAPEKGAMIFSHRQVSGDYEGRDVRGKVVLTADGGPDGIRRAEERGAIAHVHIWPSDEDAIHEMIATPVWGTPTPDTAPSIPKIPALGMKHADGSRLAELLEAGPVTVRLTSDVETKWAELPLVVCDIRGTASDKFLLVAAHIDSWYEGITDNATGDASLLEMARVLSEHRSVLRHGIRFAWWPGHSTGRYAGSTWYADTFFLELRKRCIGLLNIDSPGPRGAVEWECRYNTGEVDMVAPEVVRELSGQEPIIKRPSKAGDQSFLGVGIPSLGAYRMLPLDHPDRKSVGGCGGAWWWHTPSDTLDKADKQVLAEDTQVYVTICVRVCQSKKYPYNFGPVAADFIKYITDYQRAAGEHIDLSEPLVLAQQLKESAALFSTKVRSIDESSPGVERANATMLSLSRLLNPVLFTLAGPYEFDSALQLPVLPGLAQAGQLATRNPVGNEYQFLRTQLVRQRNRVADALSQAIEIIDGFSL